MRKDAIIDATLTGVMLIVAVAVLAGMLLMMLLTSCNGSGDKKKAAEIGNIAVKSLQLQVDDPGALKVLAISKPDSVFGSNFISNDELEVIFKNLQDATDVLMQSESMFREVENPRVMRQMQRCTQLSNIMMQNVEGVQPSDSFSGWKLKVLYDYEDNVADTVFRNERYFIFDKEQNHILHSFEIPIL